MVQMTDELIPTRASLIQRLKNWQDQSSWQDFFDTYWNLIYGVATQSGLTKLEAQEVVQDTMISVAKHMPTFKYDPAMGSFKGWLLTMTRWRITDKIRNRELPPADEDLTDHPANSESGAEAGTDHLTSDLDKLWDEEWEKNLLNAAIAKARRHLDPKQYQIFDFYVNKGWPADQIAKTFSISTGQVYMAKQRVTEKIRQEVDRLRNELI